MARRKKQYMSDDDIDSSDASSQADEATAPDWDEDPDERAERLRFTDPYGKRSKRKRNGKEDALYGVFAEDDEEHAAGSSRGSKSLRRCAEGLATCNSEHTTDLYYLLVEPKPSFLQPMQNK